jgi:hypothetical protein
MDNARPNLGEPADVARQGVLSDTERIEAEFNRVLEIAAHDRKRLQENWNMYCGLDLGQYQEADKSQAAQEGRDLDTFNLCQSKVHALHGSIMKNEADADFIPVEGKVSPLTLTLKQMYLCDKDMMDWHTSYNSLVRGGLVGDATEEMFIDKRYHPLGNIAFRCHLPGYVIFDPRWKTESVKDCEMAWVVVYLTASQIADMWPTKAHLVARDIEAVNAIGEWYDDLNNTGITPIFELDQTNAGRNLYRVIRKLQMVTEEVVVEYDEMTGIDLPAGGDYAAKLAFLNKNNPAWDPSRIKQRTERRRMCWQTVVCRAIDNKDPMEKKPCEIQIGRLPLFRWSAFSANGMWWGTVDILKDIQRKVNYREALTTNIIETSAIGSRFADPMIFGDDAGKIKDFEENSNVPGKTFWTAPGALQRNLEPRPVRKSESLQEVRDQLLRMWDYADRISMAPAAYDARSERSGESGYLYAQKQRAAEQQAYTLFAGLERHLHEKAEAYMLQAKIQYTIGGIERRFAINSGKETLTINKRYPEIDPDKIDNDFSKLPRHKVVISESPDSVTNRLVVRTVSNEALKSIPPENIGTRAILVSSLVMSLDQFNEGDKDRLREMRNLEELQAKATLICNIKKLELMTKQFEMQLSGQAPPPPPGGQKGDKGQGGGMITPPIQGANAGSQAPPDAMAAGSGQAPERPLSDVQQPGETPPPNTGG